MEHAKLFTIVFLQLRFLDGDLQQYETLYSDSLKSKRKSIKPNGTSINDADLNLYRRTFIGNV